MVIKLKIRKSLAFSYIFLAVNFYSFGFLILPSEEIREEIFALPACPPYIQIDLMFTDGHNPSYSDGCSFPKILFRVSDNSYVFIFHTNIEGESVLVWPENFEKAYVSSDELILVKKNLFFFGDYFGKENFSMFSFDKIDDILVDDIHWLFKKAEFIEYIDNLPFLNEFYMADLEKRNIKWNRTKIDFFYNCIPKEKLVMIDNKTGFPFYLNGKFINSACESIYEEEGVLIVDYYFENSLKRKIINSFENSKTYELIEIPQMEFEYMRSASGEMLQMEKLIQNIKTVKNEYIEKNSVYNFEIQRNLNTRCRLQLKNQNTKNIERIKDIVNKNWEVNWARIEYVDFKKEYLLNIKEEAFDLLLIQLSKKNHSYAFDLLMKKYQNAIRDIVLCKLKSLKNDHFAYDQIDNYLQEIRRRIWQKLGIYNPYISSFYTWAKKLCENHTITLLKKEKFFEFEWSDFNGMDEEDFFERVGSKADIEKNITMKPRG